MRAATVELDELGPVGFGGYRVDVRSRLHRAALTQALGAGCNLVDTAPNYNDGRSEEMIGEVLAAGAPPAFVITKAGYVSPRLLTEFGSGRSGLRTLPDGTAYSLHPDTLRRSLELSRARLRRPVLDAVLIHNPERLLDAGVSAPGLRNQLGCAIEVLAEEVHAGRLRYYGVSSNQLPVAEPGSPLELDALLALIAATGDADAFRFLEFPLNLIEREAVVGGLLARIPPDVRTVANRPLNAIWRGGVIRLASPAVDRSDEYDPWEECVELVRERLKALGSELPWSSFAPMQFLRDGRTDIATTELVELVWIHQIRPFVATLFDGRYEGHAREKFERLRHYANASAGTAMTTATGAAVIEFVEAGLLAPGTQQLQPTAAVNFPLDAGVDHVLVGMRRPGYVRELAPIFRRGNGEEPSRQLCATSITRSN